MKESGISNKVTEAWALEDLYVKVNSTELCEIDIVGYEAIYGGCNVPAELQFIDSRGLTTGDTDNSADIGIGGNVEIGFTTPTGCDFKETYVIKQVLTTNNSKNQKLVTLKLEDLESRNLKGSFVSKGYPEKEFSKATEEHLNELNKDVQKTTKKELVVVPPKKEQKINMVIPTNIDFYTFLNKEMKDKGFSYIKDKTKNYLVHAENKEFDKLKSEGDVYEFDTHPFSLTRIVQFNVEGFNMDGYLASIPTSVNSIDLVTNNSKDSKDGTDTKISKKDSEGATKSKISGQDPGKVTKQSVRGSKQGQKTAKDQQYFETLSNLQKMSIWVPGRVDNMVGRKIKVILPKPSYYANTGNDDLFSGEWEVYGTRDKIIGMYFMQELYIRRPGGK
jgi:hypothetical protein